MSVWLCPGRSVPDDWGAVTSNMCTPHVYKCTVHTVHCPDHEVGIGHRQLAWDSPDFSIIHPLVKFIFISGRRCAQIERKNIPIFAETSHIYIQHQFCLLLSECRPSLSPVLLPPAGPALLPIFCWCDVKTEDAAVKLRACRLSAAVGRWAAPAAVLQVEFSNSESMYLGTHNIWKINFIIKQAFKWNW